LRKGMGTDLHGMVPVTGRHDSISQHGYVNYGFDSLMILI